MIFTSYYDEQIVNEVRNEMTVADNNSDVNRAQRSQAKPSKQLPEKAIRLMNEWFVEHEDNPYPNRNDLDYLATNGGIKESQVKAWFSNKRNRTQNTHPKRAKRYLIRTQAQQNSTFLNEPRKIHVADQFEQRALSLQQQQQQQEQQQQSYPCAQLSSTHPTNWPWLPPTPYDCYYQY
ncbi:unnamed protein product [Rotaria magnacalcarata]|uniref:Homeobox domain-containing protein n=2 Tax=Rotaria magnacalcarata TaxID=392030 RepID=A0A814WQ89_9BILA|nr:unnamed protein product [Rotaria magnacalcarata]CAF1684098.1 unnamed protein product [Rotaria magnacalcarata]CAF3767053.1 unnamed protein product [Rotaria magnacalcarata]CAF3834818.1 unnamed protein product [Rotaria magnacalcarata]CAF5115014.1 unnamed protein product [Rotaria magnacalcarata]